MSISSDEATTKRQRVSRACDLCRKKKIKCDGAAPVCGNCQAFHLECSYKDTTKKRGPPKGYIEAIENRLHKLEAYLNDVVKEEQDDPRTLELIRELQSPLETPAGETIKGRPQRRQRRNNSKQAKAASTDTAMASPLSPLFDSPTLTHSELPDEHTTSSSTAVGSPANDSTGQLSMDENGGVRYLGKSSGFYLLSNSRTYQNGAFHFSGYAHQYKVDQQQPASRKRRYSNVDPFELPPKDLSEHLITLYFTHFYPVLPMFYKRRLVCSASPLEPVSPLLLNAIYAIASRVSPDERVRSDPNAPDTAGDIFYERAKCLLDDYYDTPKISTVQALLLMASHQQGAMKSARAWLYSGMAFRMAQDLGLNRNCDHWNISPEERERRKRVFWCCYIVDRVTSAIYGRSSNFEERDCDVPFPAVDDDEPIASKQQQDQSRPPIKLLELFTQNIKICEILGHVLKNIYYVKAKHHTDSQYIDHILTTLHRQLLQWHSNLPLALQYKLPNTQIGEKGPDPPSAICQLHLTYYTTMILLHRSFIPGPTQSHLPITLPSYKICESAATSILDIVNIMLGENHLRYMHNFSVFFVFTAGIIFIKMASSVDPSRAFDAKVNINRIMRALDDLEVTWMNAARCCNILGELAGLRDIKLECDKYVPKLDSNKSSPPPCIAVPNSPEVSHADSMPAMTTDYSDWNTSTSSANSTPAPQKDLNTSFSLYLPTPTSSIPISSMNGTLTLATFSSNNHSHLLKNNN
ncbi:Zn(2)-C6 fungal-specific transcription factor [Mucor lusitanicus CBS 277.49]|uniref:Zn(2)-C6 fungal-specific transcription factor n=1 Tax=Mucor lusitanicus CBS 277.49 TaxID=747725 RepID=A0A168KMU0_MUCCL|nr:Zn(2)-C6 fungal-specific transcription factor [Mucor lusitanicus CBS 277.49]